MLGVNMFKKLLLKNKEFDQLGFIQAEPTLLKQLEKDENKFLETLDNLTNDNNKDSISLLKNKLMILLDYYNSTNTLEEKNDFIFDWFTINEEYNYIKIKYAILEYLYYNEYSEFLELKNYLSGEYEYNYLYDIEKLILFYDKEDKTEFIINNVLEDLLGCFNILNNNKDTIYTKIEFLYYLYNYNGYKDFIEDILLKCESFNSKNIFLFEISLKLIKDILNTDIKDFKEESEKFTLANNIVKFLNKLMNHNDMEINYKQLKKHILDNKKKILFPNPINLEKKLCDSTTSNYNYLYKLAKTSNLFKIVYDTIFKNNTNIPKYINTMLQQVIAYDELGYDIIKTKEKIKDSLRSLIILNNIDINDNCYEFLLNTFRFDKEAFKNNICSFKESNIQYIKEIYELEKYIQYNGGINEGYKKYFLLFSLYKLIYTTEPNDELLLKNLSIINLLYNYKEQLNDILINTQNINNEELNKIVNILNLNQEDFNLFKERIYIRYILFQLTNKKNEAYISLFLNKVIKYGNFLIEVYKEYINDNVKTTENKYPKGLNLLLKYSTDVVKLIEKTNFSNLVSEVDVSDLLEEYIKYLIKNEYAEYTNEDLKILDDIRFKNSKKELKQTLSSLKTLNKDNILAEYHLNKIEKILLLNKKEYGTFRQETNITDNILNLIDKNKELNVKKASELFLIGEIKNNKETFNRLFEILIDNCKKNLTLGDNDKVNNFSTILHLMALRERITILSKLSKNLIENNDELEKILYKNNKTESDYALLLFKYIYYKEELEKIADNELLEVLEFIYNLESSPHWAMKSHLNNLGTSLNKIKLAYKSMMLYKYYNKYKNILKDMVITSEPDETELHYLYLKPETIKILDLDKKDFYNILYDNITKKVVNKFDTLKKETLKFYRNFLINTLNKNKLNSLLNKVIDSIQDNNKCKDYFTSIKYVLENKLTEPPKENKKLAKIICKCISKQEIDNSYDEFLNYEYRNNKDIFKKIINKLSEKNEELVNDFILNFEFNFKTEEDKKNIVYDKIDYILNNCYRNSEEIINKKLFIFNFLYKHYNKTNNIKELIDLVIEDKYDSLKEQIANSKEDNIDLYYRKDELYYLDKIKNILNLNKKEFNNFKCNLINYSFIVDLASTYGVKKQLNKNKLNELYLIENRDKLKEAFEISIKHYKGSVYRNETYRKGTKNYADYNGMLATIISLQKRIYAVNPKWLLKQTESEKLKEILTSIIHKKELPVNEKINSFLYFELEYKKGYFIKVLEDIKLNLINEEPNMNKINYYIKFIDSLKYYYDSVFYLNYELINKNIQKTKLTNYLNNRVLLPQYEDKFFNLGIKEIIQKYKLITNNITLQNKLKENTLKEKLIPNTVLKTNINKIIKIEIYNHNNITLRIKIIKDILTKLVLDNLSVYNIFYELNEELDKKLNNNLKNNKDTKTINIQRNNLINLQNEIKDLYSSIYYNKNSIIKNIIYDLDKNRINKDFNYQNLEKLIIYGFYHKSKLIAIFDNLINNHTNNIKNYETTNQLIRKEINEDELKNIRNIKNETLIELKIYTQYSYNKLRDITIKFLKFISKEETICTKITDYMKSFINTLIRYNKDDLNNIKIDINNKLKQEKNTKNYQDIMRIISVLTKQEKSFEDSFYTINYFYNKDYEEMVYNISYTIDGLAFYLIRKDKLDNYEFSKYYNELLIKDREALEIAYNKTLRRYIMNKPWYIEDLDLAKRVLNSIMGDIITKKHLTYKYSFEQENELIKKALYFLLKEKNIALNIQTEIKKFLLLETKFDINRMTKIFNETRNKFKDKLKCNKNNTKQYINYLVIITTIDKLERELKNSFISLNIEETKRINLINGCIEFLLDNKKDKDPEQTKNAEQFILYNIKHYRETVENIFIKLTFKFKDNEVLSSRLAYLQRMLLGRVGF